MRGLKIGISIAAAVLTAAIVAACGGYTTVSVGGTISGLSRDGLVLANGDDTVAPKAADTTFTFPNQIADNGAYSVTVKQQPEDATCSVVNGTGYATGVAITGIAVICADNTYSVGGTISGLTGGTLVLANGTDSVTLAANSTSFTMPAKIPKGTAYGVAVVAKPNGLNCTVNNGTGIMQTTNVTNIEVDCVASP